MPDAMVDQPEHSLRVGSYNLHDYSPEAASTALRQRQHELIASLGLDVLCVQEFLVRTDEPHDPVLVEGFARFCSDLGMHGRIAVARSHCHTAVLWRPGITLDGWRDYRHWPWHHTLGVATLDIGAGQPLRVASGHFSPFSPDQRAHEAQLLGAVTPESGWMLAGLDLNTVGEHDPEPYADQPPGKHQLFQTTVTQQWPPDGPITVDRRAPTLLTRHGLADVAVHHGATDTPTSGHFPADPHGPRRVDVLRASTDLANRIADYRVITPEHDPTTAEFDHLPIVCHLNPSEDQARHSSARKN